MNLEQRNLLLEEIAAKTSPDYSTPAQVYIVGSIGSGKSSLLHGIHRELRYSNAGLEIKSNRAHSRGQLMKQRINEVRRANATLEPEDMKVYAYDTSGIIPLQLIAEGSHTKAKKLITLGREEDKKINLPATAVMCLDLTFLEYLFQPKIHLVMERCLDTDDFDLGLRFEGMTFKSDLNTAVYLSLLRARKDVQQWKKKGIPIIGIATHYHQLTKDSTAKRELSQGKLLEHLDTFVLNRDETKKDNGFGSKGIESGLCYQATPFSQLFDSPLLSVDSRSRVPYGIEEAAYQIALAATGNKHPDLRLVSFSHHVPDKERVVKYNSLPHN